MRSFNLKKALGNDSEDNLALQEMDSIAVTSVWDIRDRHSVAITGSVRKPGTYEYLAGMTVMDLIFRAGGLKESAYKMAGRGLAVDSSTIATKAAAVFRVPITSNYTFNRRFDVRAPENDQVFVREVPDWEMQRNVTITGEVLYPGTYSLQRPDESCRL